VILSQLEHENITNLIDVCGDLDFDNFNEICLIVEKMDTDLATVFRVNPPFSVDHRRFFMVQLFRGLKYLHSANVIHRDIKPSNLLVNSQCDLKICDFGLARVNDPENPAELSEYVETRWYRAPEVLLNCGSYDCGIDIWSAGCVLAELILGRPLLPGKDVYRQLELVSRLIGSPTEEDLATCSNEKARKFMCTLPFSSSADFVEVFPTAVDAEIDLLRQMMTWQSAARITAAQALEHPYFGEYSSGEREPEAFPIGNFEFERADVTMEMLKAQMWEHVNGFRQR
jgi:serine/threonine protein kinase